MNFEQKYNNYNLYFIPYFIIGKSNVLNFLNDTKQINLKPLPLF